LNAFFELDFERDVSKFEPIRRSSCFEYANDYDFDLFQTEDLWYYILRMDKAFLKYRFDNRPKPPKEPKQQRTRTRTK
jgi:hypothetical protein